MIVANALSSVTHRHLGNYLAEIQVTLKQVSYDTSVNVNLMEIYAFHLINYLSWC